ncbi:MAG: class I SAM-dependent methyltransferase [Solirubrobacterales bacterium]
MTTTEQRRAHWEGVWTTKQPEAVSWFQADPAMSLALIGDVGLRRDAAIIDVGGGASPLVDRLVDRGYVHVAVLDVSAAALAHAAERLGPLGEDVTWIESDVLAWKPVPGLFDLWHDRAVLHFLTDPADQQAYVRVLETALAPEGTVILATFAPDGPEKCSGLPVARHDGASLTRLLGAGFVLVDERAEEHATPAGGIQKFRWCVFRRRQG